MFVVALRRESSVRRARGGRRAAQIAAGLPARAGSPRPRSPPPDARRCRPTDLLIFDRTRSPLTHSILPPSLADPRRRDTATAPAETLKHSQKVTVLELPVNQPGPSRCAGERPPHPRGSGIDSPSSSSHPSQGH